MPQGFLLNFYVCYPSESKPLSTMPQPFLSKRQPDKSLRRQQGPLWRARVHIDSAAPKPATTIRSPAVMCCQKFTQTKGRQRNPLVAFNFRQLRMAVPPSGPVATTGMILSWRIASPVYSKQLVIRTCQLNYSADRVQCRGHTAPAPDQNQI